MAERPYSTFLTLAIALVVSLVTSLLNRKFIDREKFTAWRQEINQFNTEKKLAKKTGDNKLLAKIKKREPQILQIQSKMAKQQEYYK